MPFQMTSWGVGLGQGSDTTERQTPVFLHTHAYSDHLTKTNIFLKKTYSVRRAGIRNNEGELWAG